MEVTKLHTYLPHISFAFITTTEMPQYFASKTPSFGRGGAGNIEAVKGINPQIPADLEANQAGAGSYAREPMPSDYPEREEPQYAHSGRGGAGNYYSPKEISKTGSFSDGPVRSSSSGGLASGPSTTPGRGGAGNYAFSAHQSAADTATKSMEEGQTQEKLKQDIAKSVEEQLAMPQKAKLPGGEPS